MTQFDNLNEDQEQALARRDYLAAQFGPDVLVGLATDGPVTGHSSAAVIDQDRRDALRELRREERRDRIATAQALEADQAAYERVISSQGTGQDERAADRHIRR